MKQKVTIVDIAKAANVSVATVSYVMNEKSGQKISENTRKKVLQIANFLGYSGNSFARSLVTGKCNRVALYLGETSFALKKAYYMKVIDQLTVLLSKSGYSLLLVPSSQIGVIKDVDAIVTLNTSNETFRKIGDENFVPLIAIDCLVDDPIFYQLNFDYSKIGSGYDIVLSLYQNDRKLRNEIVKHGNVMFVDSFLEIQSILCETVGKKILCLGTTLYDYCSAFSGDVECHKLDIETLINTLIGVIKVTINREETNIEHDIKI